MTTTNLFSGEVARLEQQLADATRGRDNAEKNSARLSDLLAGAKAEAAGLAGRVETLEAEKDGLARQLQEARSVAGRLSAAETTAAQAAKDLAAARKEIEGLADRLEKAEHAHSQARADYLGTKAERDQLRDELGPAKELAAAVRDRAEADDRSLAAARRIS